MDNRSDRLACADVLMRFVDCLDHRRNEELAALVTPDCVWASGGTVVGHAAIRARLAARPADRTTLHLVTNLVVDIVAEDRALARCCILVYRFEAAMAQPSPLTAPRLVARCHDELVRLDGNWLIARRDMTTLAERPD